MIKHNLATWFLWCAHKLEPKWIEGILKINANTQTEKPEQTPAALPPSQYDPTTLGKDMIAEDRHFPPPFDRSPDEVK